LPVKTGSIDDKFCWLYRGDTKGWIDGVLPPIREFSGNHCGLFLLRAPGNPAVMAVPTNPSHKDGSDGAENSVLVDPLAAGLALAGFGHGAGCD
jgi:hypothetical protein